MTDHATGPQIHVRPSLKSYATSRLDDEALAVRIREDGRQWIQQGARIDLQEYLDALPEIEQRRLPLDAAIDVVLKSNSRTSKPDPMVVASLVRKYPHHQQAIRNAAELSAALWSTGPMHAGPDQREDRTLPAGFGPNLKDNAPRYQLVEHIGTGATAEVFRAIDRHLSEPTRPAVVAIKILRGRLTDPPARRRITEEAARARSITHPNVVKIYDLDETPDGESFIVQELVDGGDLQSWMERKTENTSAQESARLLLAVARGVQAVHARGLVHLDLKPANILLTHEGTPKISDFGLASNETTSSKSENGIRGTTAFMSPEQFFAEPAAQAPQADVYSLGGILHLMLTGKLPNGDTIEEITATHHTRRVRNDALQRACKQKKIDPDIVAVCTRALEPDLKDRYHSAAEFAENLESWIRHEPIRWTNPSPARKLRLFAARHPALLLTFIGFGLALSAAAVAFEFARHYSNIAHTEAIKAQANANLLQAEQEWKAHSARSLEKLMGAILDVKQTGLAGEVLTSLWMLEWVQGPTLLNRQEHLPQIWAARMKTVQGLLDERRAEGGEDSFDALQYEALLAFWHLQNDDFAKAQPLIDHSLEHWRTKLDPADPWLQDLEIIQECATVDRLLAGHVGKLAGSARASVLQHEQSLRHQYERLAARNDGAQLRLLVLERLQRLYAPSVLGSTEWLAWANGQRRALGLSTQSKSRPPR